MTLNRFARNAFGGSSGLSQTQGDARYARLAAANTFTRLQTITQGTANEGILASTGYSLTGSNATSMIDLAGTWNTSGAPTALKINITNTASENSSKLIDLQIGGTTRFSVIPTATGSVTEFGSGASSGIGLQLSSSVATLGRSDGDGGISGATDVASWATNNNVFAVNNILAIGRVYASRDLFLTRKAAATLQMGEDAAGVTNQMFTAANRITSDGVGANLTIAPGNGRGAAGGSLILSTFTTAGAATAGTLTTRLTLDTAGLLTFADAVNVAFDTTTGTKLGTDGTQKLGFWNATPVVQQVLATGAAHTVDDVITFLQTVGLCKQS